MRIQNPSEDLQQSFFVSKLNGFTIFAIKAPSQRALMIFIIRKPCHYIQRFWFHFSLHFWEKVQKDPRVKYGSSAIRRYEETHVYFRYFKSKLISDNLKQILVIRCNFAQNITSISPSYFCAFIILSQAKSFYFIRKV